MRQLTGSVVSLTTCGPWDSPRGSQTRACFITKKKDVKTLVHGGDYASVGNLEGLAWLRKHLDARFEMKTVLVGHSDAPEVVREAKILNRVVRATDAGWEYECDQRHVVIILEHLRLTEAKPLGTPGVEETAAKEESRIADPTPLNAPEATLYRAVVFLAKYIA